MCQVSHYVNHLDENQTIAQYDYFWCNTHACVCGPDGCTPANTGLQADGAKCPECDSEILPDKFCMMGHWCGERPAAKA